MQRLRVLLVEDSEEDAQLLQLKFRDPQWLPHFKRVQDETALREALDKSTWDLIISDYRLSDGKTGIEAIAELRSAFPQSIPAFLVSGDTSLAPLRETLAGGLHLLHKPVDPMTLRAMLNRLLERNS